MRTKATLPTVVVGITLLLASGPVWAHHAMIWQFALDKPVTLNGTLTKMDWKNPHGWIYMDVKRADGEVENWAVETGSPYKMQKGGLRKGDFQHGMKIIVGGFLAKDGTRTAAGLVVVFPDREVSTPDQPSTFALGR